MTWNEEIEKWQQRLDVHFGTLKEQVFEKFKEWQGKKKTCQRCQEELFQYRQYCPIQFICQEAENGSSEDRPTILRKESSGSPRNLKVKSLRTTPKRCSVGQHRG